MDVVVLIRKVVNLWDLAAAIESSGFASHVQVFDKAWACALLRRAGPQRLGSR